MTDLRVVGEAPARGAAIWGRRTALCFNRRRYTYDDLAIASSSLASRLVDLGLTPGERVAILLENRPEYLHAYFAVPAAAGVLVPLNSFLAPTELHEVLRDSAATILLTSDAGVQRLAHVLRGLPGLRQVLICGELPDPVPALPDGIAVDALTPSGPAGRPATAHPPRAVVSHPDDTAVLIYTSGTTGRPKGVMLTHRNLLANAEACIEAVGATQRDRILLFLPMFHSFAQMVGMLAPIVAGMGIVLCEKIDRAEVRRAIKRHRPTIVPAVPAVYAAMTQVKLSRLARWLNPVRLYISGGAPLSLDTLSGFERVYRRPLCEGYGLSEASPVVALNPPAGPRKPGSIGVPLPGVDVLVVDESGRPVATGESGELLVRGPNVMKGYYGRPDETDLALAGGWLHTGDIVQRDEDGYLHVIGRRKEMLIYRGMNIFPREIEDVIQAHPGIKEVAVIGVPDAARGEVPYAFVVSHPGHRPSEADLRRACIDRLARYKVPRGFRFVPELPRNAAGKVIKAELRVAAAAQPSG